MISSLLISAILFLTPGQVPTVAIQDDKSSLPDSISWMTINDINPIVEKNIKKNKIKENKLIIVDFYTDWCGWCKKLDQITYRDTAVIRLMNTYFYAVKFDAEGPDTIRFANQVYGFKKMGSRGTNEFALAMATRPGGRLGYPTMTIISPMGEKIAVEGGYKDPVKMVAMLRFYGEGYYKTMDFQTFITTMPTKPSSSEFSD